jgi:hypothetical protein
MAKKEKSFYKKLLDEIQEVNVESIDLYDTESELESDKLVKEHSQENNNKKQERTEQLEKKFKN